ncbi:hypothetical protein L596_008441 [Steinernema carpocapsae]|uniref:Uncharacterized protein n=1 Tax=Steinernema carpocapsae TaxID=34508 RepID=A0A4U5PD10_STECR|nr:hypothetical protein L596_008441 [Steinernema carpocapsae]
MEFLRGLYTVCLDVSARKCEIIINGRMTGPLVTVADVTWWVRAFLVFYLVLRRLLLMHDCDGFYIIIHSSSSSSPLDAKRCFLVDANYSLIVRSKNSTAEHPYRDAYMRPEILHGVSAADSLVFRICDFSRLEDFADSNEMIHVEFWLAYRKTFFALGAPRR